MEIRFKDVRFPTLLHAQWAVLLHGLAVEWRFRPIEITLPDGRPFTPDFHLVRQRYWLQIGAVSWNNQAFADWRQFAPAADTVRCRARQRFTPGAECDHHLYPHTVPWLPKARRADLVLYAGGGLPDATDAEASGMFDSSRRSSMYSGVGWRYRWRRCAQCGTVSAVNDDVAVDAACEHDAMHNGVADDPLLQRALTAARYTTVALQDGTCAGCRSWFRLGELIIAGTAVRSRRWYHAECHLRLSDDCGDDGHGTQPNHRELSASQGSAA
ncbi:hypothetical protein [Actinoplanes teichomyceticus]|uniref:Uncharacterized protein n=1 Tax=Actinoplanes teichomyceticus TaxID=1867 RepID=A0A561VGF2_ACTTI|nr:hypothetical protein [Actinoplanes teichomyceticus]TWG10706.1 hypothetical protein FHX34_107202 [Actinoplanes teichomyceticus]GIF15472.1 hypothetical protein Ate01nite_55040 [Actinoplanes teichomyceticus]